MVFKSSLHRICFHVSSVTHHALNHQVLFKRVSLFVPVSTGPEYTSAFQGLVLSMAIPP